MILLIFPLLAVFQSQPERVNDKDVPFMLHCEVVSALEGGPLVLRFSLTYTGQKPLEVDPLSADCFTVVPSKEWEKKRRWESTRAFVGGVRGPSTILMPGKQWIATYYVHHHYREIPAGSVTFRLQWPVYAPEKLRMEGNLLAKLSKEIKVDIPRATGEGLSNMVELFEARLRNPNLSDEERRHLAECVLYTPHQALVPVALQIVKAGGNIPSRGLIQFIYDQSKTPRHAHVLLVDYLREENPVAAVDAFDFWGFVQWKASLQYVCDRIPTPHGMITTLLRYLTEPLFWEIGPHRDLVTYLINPKRKYREFWLGVRFLLPCGIMKVA